MNNSKEWIESFNLHYNNSDKSAPELNAYEISLFLTQAQDEVVKELYSGKNIFHEAFDNNEHIRTALEYLVRTESLNPLELSRIRNFTVTKFKPTEYMWYPVYEEVGRDTSTIPIVIPTTWDELNVNLINPFKQPNCRKVLRISKQDGVYIISSIEVTTYEVTYLIEPDPIILVDLKTDPLFADMGLSIKGKTEETQCKLGSNIHLNILNRAVELALRDYNPSNLEAHVQLNQRNF